MLNQRLIRFIAEFKPWVALIFDTASESSVLNYHDNIYFDTSGITQ